MNKRWSLVAAGGVLLLAAGLPVAAEMEEVDLSLSDCLETALRNNLDLVLSRKDPQIAEQNVVIQQAAFDPALSADLNHSESKGEPSQVFTADRSKVDSWSAGWTDPLSFGGQYSVQLQSTKVDAANAFRLYNPSYESRLALNYQMPLLNGLGKEVATERVLLSQGNLKMSREELRRQADATLETVEDAYWNLLAVRDALRVANESLKRAQDLLDLNRKKVEVGTLAPIEITQAEAGVASQEENVIVAQTNLENAEDVLRQLLAVPPDDPLWQKRIVPVDNPDVEKRSFDLEATIAQALTSRPELKSAEQDLRNSELSERVSHNELLPGLDLALNLTPNGNNLKDVVLGPGPDGVLGTADDQAIAVTGGQGEALSEIPKFRNYDWSVGLTFSLPVGNRAAKASYASAKLNREKSEIALENLRQNIRVDVRQAVRAVESGFKRVEAARANVVLQKKKLEAEQKKFENGMSTSFEVLTFQNDLATAELAEIQALTDYKKALAAVERAKGTLLEARGLTLEE